MQKRTLSSIGIALFVLLATGCNLLAARYYNARGLTYYRKGDYEHALGDFIQAIKLGPRMVNAWNLRCLAYTEKGNYDQAIRDCNGALRLQPNLDEARLNRGLAYARKGGNASAAADFDQVRREAASEANRKRGETLAKELVPRENRSP
jgi:tetratricopeptide (TPR) repeat protein